jgi:hypothetical protein
MSTRGSVFACIFMVICGLPGSDFASAQVPPASSAQSSQERAPLPGSPAQQAPLPGSPVAQTTPQPSTEKSVTVTDGKIQNAGDAPVLVNNRVLQKNDFIPIISSLNSYILTVFSSIDGDVCRAVPTGRQDTTLKVGEPLTTPLSKENPVANNISISDIKFVDNLWLKQRLGEAEQALASINPFNGSAVTGQTNTLQGATNSSAGISVQLNGAPGGTASSSAPSQAASPASAPTTTVGISSTGALERQVELNAELLKFRALYRGVASDNFLIGGAGHVQGNRRQVTIAVPIDVSSFPNYNGAVAEVRVFMIPTKGSKGKLSIVNLLPESRSYNVATTTTNTKQFGVGVSFEAISAGFAATKSKSALFLAKDSDVVAMQYSNPSADTDKDSKSPWISRLRYKLPVDDSCPTTSKDSWDKANGDGTNGYDQAGALVFGWQFRPVLDRPNVEHIQGLYFAQIALDEKGDAPAVFVETRWRAYDRKSGVVGLVYKESCSWRRLSNATPLNYDPDLWNVQTVDAGSGNLRVTANGIFADPNLQIRLGNTLLAPDRISSDGKTLELFLPATDLLRASEFQLIGTDTQRPLTIPLATASRSDAAKKLKCTLETVTATAVPFADGSAQVTMHLKFGADRSKDSQQPIILLGSTVYGLQDHPFLDHKFDKGKEGVLAFSTTLSAIRTSPSLLVKDIDWSETSQVVPIKLDPTFKSFEPVAAPGAPAKYTAGLYRLTGTGFTYTNIVACGTAPCLSVLDSKDGNRTPVAGTLTILNDTTALYKLPKDLDGTAILSWVRDSLTSEWVMSTKDTVTPEKKIAANTSLKKGDIRTVTFTGKDFTTVQTVTFGDAAIKVLKKSDTELTVFVIDKVTETEGSKELIATLADNSTIVLPLEVSSR